jgi:hypothetical protein
VSATCRGRAWGLNDDISFEDFITLITDLAYAVTVTSVNIIII